MEKELKDNIMRRVHTVYTCKKCVQSSLFKLSLFVIFILYVVSMVSMTNILVNMPSLGNMSAVFNFYFVAFAQTYFTVQITFVAIAFVGVFLIKDISRTQLFVFASKPVSQKI